MLGRHGGGGGGGGRRHGGGHRHGGRGRGRGWGGPHYGYPYYGYPYFDDFYYRTPDPQQSQPQIIVVDKGRDSGSGINWPTIAISMALSAFMLMKMGH